MGEYEKAFLEFGRVRDKNPGYRKVDKYFIECQVRKSEKEVVTKKLPEEEVSLLEVKESKVVMEKEPLMRREVEEKAEIIHSTDVISEIKAIEEEGRVKVVITLSGEREYNITNGNQPQAVIIDIPHTINTIFPETIPVNRGCIKMIKATQHRCLPFDEARITVVLNRWAGYRIKSTGNEIYIEFEGGE